MGRPKEFQTLRRRGEQRNKIHGGPTLDNVDLPKQNLKLVTKHVDAQATIDNKPFKLMNSMSIKPSSCCLITATQWCNNMS